MFVIRKKLFCALSHYSEDGRESIHCPDPRSIVTHSYNIRTYLCKYVLILIFYILMSDIIFIIIVNEFSCIENWRSQWVIYGNKNTHGKEFLMNFPAFILFVVLIAKIRKNFRTRNVSEISYVTMCAKAWSWKLFSNSIEFDILSNMKLYSSHCKISFPILDNIRIVLERPIHYAINNIGDKIW